MNQDLFSVEQVAERLGLHVRTVRNYVRDGRLKAVRIGKQYRIARENLEALTGQTATSAAAARAEARRLVEVSSIVQIDTIAVDDANRITNALMAAAKGRPATEDPLRIDTIHDPERARLKVIVTGSIATTATLLRSIGAYLES